MMLLSLRGRVEPAPEINNNFCYSLHPFFKFRNKLENKPETLLCFGLVFLLSFVSYLL